MRVLVGTDGSSAAQAALAWAGELVRAKGGTLVVARAWKPSFSEVSPSEHDSLRADAAEELSRWNVAVEDEDGEVVVQRLLLDGDPRSMLVDAAESEDVDLVVVGARGSGGHAHPIHLGSVTHHLAHHVTRPLAAIPEVTAPAWPQPVVLGVDGSAGSLEAMSWCARFMPGLASEVVVVHAEEVLADWMPRTDPTSWEQVALEHLRKWMEPLRGAGLDARPAAIPGDAVHALCDAAAEVGAAAVVVGARGLGGVTGLRLGAVALKVVHRSQVPVIMVPLERG